MRRHVMLVVAAAVVAGSCGAAQPLRVPPRSTAASSQAKAYVFLNEVMDRYAHGPTRRLVQSYVGGPLARQHFTDSVTYDDALVIDAYIAQRTAAALLRARTIASALIFIQHHDPAGDGRIRASYSPQPLTSAASIHIRDRASDVGNMAWVGMALVRLAAVTGDHNYLAAAERIGDWVRKHCHDSRGPGGYTGGVSASGARIRWKSTEHNEDLFGLYTMLWHATGKTRYEGDAGWALRFVQMMWIQRERRFYVGTGTNGKTPNNDEKPEDVNSWSFLSVRDADFDQSLDWNVRHLSVTGPYNGVSFCAGDRSGVWFEGTAQLADALRWRGGHGDAARAASYLADIRTVQQHGPNTDGRGIIAASKNRLSDCDGDSYFSSLHVGATAWYLLALQKVNPFAAPTNH